MKLYEIQPHEKDLAYLTLNHVVNCDWHKNNVQQVLTALLNYVDLLLVEFLMTRKRLVKDYEQFSSILLDDVTAAQIVI